MNYAAMADELEKIARAKWQKVPGAGEEILKRMKHKSYWPANKESVQYALGKQPGARATPGNVLDRAISARGMGEKYSPKDLRKHLDFAKKQQAKTTAEAAYKKGLKSGVSANERHRLRKAVRAVGGSWL